MEVKTRSCLDEYEAKVAKVAGLLGWGILVYSMRTISLHKNH